MLNFMFNVYLQFLSLVEALDHSRCNHPKLDEASKKLLEVIAVKHQQGKTMTVTDALILRQIASPATIHRKLFVLMEAGWIDLVFRGKNRRTKYILPTIAANEYFEQLDLLMGQASQSINRHLTCPSNGH